MWLRVNEKDQQLSDFKGCSLLKCEQQLRNGLTFSKDKPRHISLLEVLTHSLRLSQPWNQFERRIYVCHVLTLRLGAKGSENWKFAVPGAFLLALQLPSSAQTG